MTTYSNYKITSNVKDKDLYLIIKDRLGDAKCCWHMWSGASTWHGPIESIVTISKLFPSVMFKMEIVEEDPLQYYSSYWLDGKSVPSGYLEQFPKNKAFYEANGLYLKRQAEKVEFDLSIKNQEKITRLENEIKRIKDTQ